MNLLRILGAYALLLVVLILACNIVLGVFAGDEARQIFAVVVVLCLGLVGALVVFALQRARARRALATLESQIPVSQRSLVQANAAVAACAAACVLTWFWFYSVITQSPDAQAAVRFAGWVPALSAIIATVALAALCRLAPQLPLPQRLFRVALVLLLALVGVALVPDIVLRAAAAQVATPHAKSAQIRDAWVLLPALAFVVCLVWKRGRTR